MLNLQKYLANYGVCLVTWASYRMGNIAYLAAPLFCIVSHIYLGLAFASWKDLWVLLQWHFHLFSNLAIISKHMPVSYILCWKKQVEVWWGQVQALWWMDEQFDPVLRWLFSFVNWLVAFLYHVREVHYAFSAVFEPLLFASG